MSIKINFSNKNTGKSSVNNVLFADEKFNINGLKKYLSSSEFSYIKDLLKTSDLKKNIFFCQKRCFFAKFDVLQKYIFFDKLFI